MIYDPLELTTELIKCRSVTPRNDGAIELLSEKLENIGSFTAEQAVEEIKAKVVDLARLEAAKEVKKIEEID